jgi:hypothetical protein
MPGLVKAQLAAKCLTPQRDYGQHADALVLQRANEAFDHCDASLLAHGAETLADAAPLAPAPQVTTDELRALIADEVLGRLTAARDDTSQECRDLLGRRLGGEDGDAVWSK